MIDQRIGRGGQGFRGAVGSARGPTATVQPHSATTGRKRGNRAKLGGEEVIQDKRYFFSVWLRLETAVIFYFSCFMW